MQDPETYIKNSSIQRKHAQDFLEEYSRVCVWKRGAAIIDIGSGDGFVTSNVLKKYIPEEFGKIIGIDISKEMVNFANKHYATERIQFLTLDVAGSMPYEFKQSFQYAVSFYCLHWVYDQRKVFQNIYDVLSEDGNCLITLIQSSRFYEMFIVLACSEKWRHLKGRPIQDMVSKYYDSKTPEKDLRNVMEETGFKEIIVERKSVPHYYDSVESMKGFVLALNPLKLPQDRLQEFGVDVIRVMSDLHLMETVGKGPGVVVDTTQIVAYAKKISTFDQSNA